MESMAGIQQFSISVVLVSLRILPFFLGNSMTPMARMPMLSRVVLILAVALIIVFIKPQEVSYLITTHVMLIVMGLRELFLGIILVFGIQCMMAALQTLGRVLDMQIGYGAAGIVDPRTQQSESLLGSLLFMVASVMFLEFNLHHDIIRLLSLSFSIVPIGVEFKSFNVLFFAAELGNQFFLALLLAFPVIIALFVLDLMIGFMSKTMPQANIYFVGLPLKIGTGLIVLSIAARQLGPAYQKMFQSINQYWASTLVT